MNFRPALVLSLLLIAAALGIGMLANAIGPVDVAISKALSLRTGQSPAWTIAAMQGVSWLGGGVRRWVLVAIGVGLLWRSAGRDNALIFAATAIAANLASDLLKILFGRPRPVLVPHLDHVTSFAYPSGHATSVTAVVIALALLAPPRWRRAAIWLAALAIPLTGLSRVMLGVHWPSDVVGGTMLGAAVALAARAIAVQRKTAFPSPPNP